MKPRGWLQNAIGDTHALAAARIAFGVLLLLQTREMAIEQLDEGYFASHFHFPYIPERFVPDVHTYTLLLATQAVCAVLVIVGHMARPALLFSGGAITYAMLCDRLHFHHNRWALACYAILLSFTPCDRARSLGAPKDAPSTGDLWAVRLAQLQVSIVYVASGSSKLFDRDWRSGQVLLVRFLRHGHQAVERGVPESVVSFFQQPVVASLLAKGAITTEIFLAFALLSRRLRIAALFVGLCFHCAIELTSSVELFSFTTFAAYLLFATPDARARSLRYDPTRRKAVVLARVVRALDWLARFEVAAWEPDAISASRSFVVTDRDGKPRTGARGLVALMRGLPLLFPIWCILQLMRPKLVAAAAVVLLALAPAVARADDRPESASFGYSPYERETIEMVRKKLGATVDPHPEGKIIEAILTERLEVFERRDFLPMPLLFVNVLHATSRDRVIRREVLQRAGDRYSKLAMDETARNLRALSQLSLVIVVALRGRDDDHVKVVVVTKDVWSLRLQWDIQLTNGGLQELVLEPAETNLAGLDDTLGANFLYQPLSTALGAYYVVPRLSDLHLQLSTSANVVFSNHTGAPEGSFGSIGAAHPLWNTHEKWGWSANAAWRDDVGRVYSNAELAHVHLPTPQQNAVGYVYRPDLGAYPENAVFADEYKRFESQGSVAVARSFGWATKNDFTLSFEASHRQFLTDDLSTKDPTAAQAFLAQYVPTSDDRVYPALEWRLYRNDFLRVLDMETFGLQEDARLGYFLDVKLYPVTRALGSSRNLMGVYAEAGYTLGIRDGVLRVDVQTTTEPSFDDGRVAQGDVDATSYFASPRTPIGRLVFSARVVDTYANYLKARSFLGADTRLRGYPSSFFSGQNLVAANLEYRSRPLEIWKVQLGGVAFYDVGDAFDCWSSDPACTGSRFQPVHDVGFGLRALFPTFDRIVFRADVGFPISASPLPAGVGPVTFFVTFGQAFPYPSLGLSSSNVGSLVSTATR